ncbi:MAG TPA: penicillin acylase family protein [Stenotrophomonas sp.]|jgi:penicillin amidase
MHKGFVRGLIALPVIVVAIVLLAALAVWVGLRGSLPMLDGRTDLAGLAAPVKISRDALGVVTIDAASEADAMRALGYVHAQERYFEMDLMRRSAAGELAELFGPAAIELDQQNRVHRLRARVQAHLSTALGDQTDVATAYRDGANAGLAGLRARPWAYLLLRQAPRAWSLDDSVLVGLAMYGDLQDNRNRGELALESIREVVPPALYALIAHDGSSWDAPLAGPPRGDAVLPDAATLDLRQLAAAPGARAAPATEVVGSNNFAVSGALTADGRAILADDMHLSLRAPNVWFRARLRYPDPRAPGGHVDVSGFTLPGIPAVIVGSNGHVAWGFTNSYIDTADYARLSAAQAAGQLRTYPETIRVAGGAPVTFPVRESAWGPVLHEDPDGSVLTLRWTAQLPGAVRMDFAGMSRAGDLDQALSVADRAGIPAQNLLLADAGGRIAWRIVGARPDRGPGCRPGRIESEEPAAPSVSSEISTNSSLIASPAACAPWPLRTDRAPSLIDPPTHRLWTANSRVVDEATLAVVGNAGYDLGARASQIRDDLFARDRFAERDLLAIQLDDRALFLARWYPLLRQVVAGSDEPAMQRLAQASAHWDGHAAIDSSSYRLVRGFRDQVLDRIASGLLAPAKAQLGERFLPPPRAQLEGVAWPLLQQRPANLLPPPFASWDALLLDAAHQLERELSEQAPDPARWTWGARNTTAICHPISRALPAVVRPWLCMPAEPLPGDRDMPRVQGPTFGASERMVVSPGHEADGLIHMPGGQSGHPLSPFWGAGHDAWAQGRATPFLPGPATHVLTLSPVTAR